MDLRLDDPDPRIRDLAYLLFLEDLLGGKWVERWARERGKLGRRSEDADHGQIRRSDCAPNPRGWTIAGHSKVASRARPVVWPDVLSERTSKRRAVPPEGGFHRREARRMLSTTTNASFTAHGRSNPGAAGACWRPAH